MHLLIVTPPYLEVKDNTLMSTENRELYIYIYIYIYIHGFHIKIYRNFDGVPPYTERSQVIDMQPVYISNNSHFIT